MTEMNDGIMVHVIESPRDLDLLDERHEGGALARTLTLAGIPNKLYVCVRRRALREALVRIVTFHEANDGVLPIIHLSAHGNEDGIALTSELFLTWKELGELLRPIGEAAEGDVLLCMSTCMGFHALKMAWGPKHAPFSVVVGPKEEVTWAQTLVAFSSLYLRFSSCPSTIDEDVAAMNAAAGLDDVFKSIEATTVKRKWRAQLFERLRKRGAARRERLATARAALTHLQTKDAK